METDKINIISLNVGKPTIITYRGQEISTGIYKNPVDGPLYLSKTQLTGDGQADLKYHGGVEKAVCVYSYEHYPYWEKELARPLAFGAFGENLTVTGMLEADVCIGDTFQWGEAVVQVSQPRQPCHKLAKKYDLIDMPVRVQNSGFTGFYLRVLTEGTVAKTDQIKLLQRHPQQVTLTYANQIMHHDKHDREGLERLLAVAELSSSWRNTFEKRLNGIEVDSKERLLGK